MTISTPWGTPDDEIVYAEGVTFYRTPSHGGFWLDHERNAKLHPLLRESSGWYEEDCAWSKVVFTFPELFSEKDREAALATVKHWYPDAYEAITGVALRPGESLVKDERRFKKAHVDDWVVISAIRSDRHPGMVECAATGGGARPAIAERHYLVPENEYARSGRFGFVIDEARHAFRDGPDAMEVEPREEQEPGRERASREG
ncbi:MAG: hypothetical protein C3F11_15160 [Methylocystaceae bacterium]|nr:MAG: hypothetical protein C3F11_15160 [Methylocystaceae bacterium]